MTTLIDGKHPKMVIIDYYDNLISDLDICAENIFKSLTNECFDGNEMRLRDLDDYLDLSERPNDDDFEIQFNNKYTFDEPIESHRNILIKDFVNKKRANAVLKFKEIQKDRLEKMKLSTMKPTSIAEALFGEEKIFGFVVNINENAKVRSKMKYGLLAVVADFYLTKIDISDIE